MNWIPYAVGAALLAASFHLGSRFHPPGEGYAEERRNGRISMALLCAGIAALVAPFLL